MTIDEVKNLHNIKPFTLSNNHVIYRYASSIPTGISRKYYPLCISDSLLNPRYRLYDYSDESTKLLNTIILTYSDVQLYYGPTKNFYYIDNLTLNQAQEIINNNIYLFTKINTRLQQDLLIAKLCLTQNSTPSTL